MGNDGTFHLQAEHSVLIRWCYACSHTHKLHGDKSDLSSITTYKKSIALLPDKETFNKWGPIPSQTSLIIGKDYSREGATTKVTIGWGSCITTSITIITN